MSAADEPVHPPLSHTSASPRVKGRRLPLVVAALVGLVVGVAATIAVVIAVDGDESDVDLACTLVGRIESADDFPDDGDPADLDRMTAAAELFRAAGGGDSESELGKRGVSMQNAVARIDVEATQQALDEAGDYCNDR